ncbi:MAG: hypothetical protein FWH14_05610 [Oscillospiraceae bacterium]|nr:hypothetical protein [Oscillospiraceae bacterium]
MSTVNCRRGAAAAAGVFSRRVRTPVRTVDTNCRVVCRDDRPRSSVSIVA